MLLPRAQIVSPSPMLLRRRRGSGLPGTYYDFTGATLPSPWDTLRRAGLGTRIDAAGAVGYGEHNLLAFATDYNAATWTRLNTTVSGQVLTSVSSGTQAIYGNGVNVVTVMANTTYTLIARLRKGTSTDPVLRVLNSASTVTLARVALGWAATAPTVTASSGNLVGSPTISTVDGEGFYTVTVVFTSGAETTARPWLYVSDSITVNRTVECAVLQLNIGTPLPITLNPTAAAVFLPRPTHDPSTLAALGVLFEGQATELGGLTEQFDNVGWAKTNGTVTANATTAPDGATTADTFVENTATGAHSIDRSAAVTSGLLYTTSIFVKAAGRTRFSFRANNDNSVASFNLADGTFSGASNCTPSIEAFPNGWFRCALRWTATSTATVIFSRVRMLDAAGNTSYTGDGVSGLHLSASNFVAGELSSYIPNPGTGTALRTGDFAGGGISGASLTALLTPTAPFTIVLPFRKANNQATQETLIGFGAGAGAGTTNQLGIATQGTQAQLVHSGGSGALTGTLVLDGSTVNRVAVSVDPTWRGPELATTPYTGSSAGAWSFGADIRRNGTTTQPATLTSVAGMTAAGSYLVTFDVADFSGDGFTLALNGVSAGIGQVTGNGPKSYVITTSASGSPSISFIPWAGTAGQATITNLSVRRAGAMSISVNGSVVTETTGIAYTGAGTTALIPGARDSSGGQPATGFTSPGIRVASGYITGSALQALST
jgi:hypothetical protein